MPVWDEHANAQPYFSERQGGRPGTGRANRVHANTSWLLAPRPSSQLSPLVPLQCPASSLLRPALQDPWTGGSFRPSAIWRYCAYMSHYFHHLRDSPLLSATRWCSAVDPTPPFGRSSCTRSRRAFSLALIRVCRPPPPSAKVTSDFMTWKPLVWLVGAASLTR